MKLSFCRKFLFIPIGAFQLNYIDACKCDQSHLVGNVAKTFQILEISIVLVIIDDVVVVNNEEKADYFFGLLEFLYSLGLY